MISRQNYEEWLIDYLDGNLSESHRKEVEGFLANNPDIQTEFAGMEEAGLEGTKEIISFPARHLLYQNEINESGGISESNYKEWFIASIEGDLRPEQEQKLAAFLGANPALNKEFEAFQNTRLNADTRIMYPEKQKLYQKARMLPLLQNKRFFGSAAAVIGLLLLSGLWFLADKSDSMREDFSNLQAMNYQKARTIEFSAPILKAKMETRFATPVLGSYIKEPAAQKTRTNTLERMDAPAYMVQRAANLDVFTSSGPAYLLPDMVSLEMFYAYQFEKDMKRNRQTDLSEPKGVFNWLTQKIFKGRDKSNAPESKPAIWTIASWGVSKLKSMAPDDLRIASEEDQSEGTRSYSIDSDIFTYYKEEKIKD